MIATVPLKTRDILLILANVVAFVAIGIIFFALNQKPQAPQSLLAPHITMGKIILKVSNMQPMEDFYTNMLGMQIVSQKSGDVSLGFKKVVVVELLSTPNLPTAGAGDPGLDQIALVFSSRPGLAKAMQRVLATNPGLYAGGTSRGPIGEAFYVTDPQDNSLELYYDTDPSTWPRTIKGNVEGQALPIDINAYIQKYANMGGDLRMSLGHLQMRIGDITKGKDFYLKTIGFYAIPNLAGNGQSLFMSDGYYHHDLVINQAQGYDGDSIIHYQGLYGFTFSVPDSVYLKKLEERLTAAHVSFKDNGNRISFSDPWGIAITVGVTPSWWQQIF